MDRADSRWTPSFSAAPRLCQLRARYIAALFFWHRGQYRRRDSTRRPTATSACRRDAPTGSRRIAEGERFLCYRSIAGQRNRLAGAYTMSSLDERFLNSAGGLQDEHSMRKSSCPRSAGRGLTRRLPVRSRRSAGPSSRAIGRSRSQHAPCTSGSCSKCAVAAREIAGDFAPRRSGWRDR